LDRRRLPGPCREFHGADCKDQGRPKQATAKMQWEDVILEEKGDLKIEGLPFFQRE
jgi:hypothetical protein